MENIKLKEIIKLSQEETDKFSVFIKKKRASIISSPKETIKKVIDKNSGDLIKMLDNYEVSDAIFKLRELCYDEFLLEESLFNGVVLAEISKKFDMPKFNMEEISSVIYQLRTDSIDSFTDGVCRMFGQYAGSISPYIYQLCLSNTQSRRSRAGKVFEGIVYYLYEHYGYSYESQSSIGRKVFSELNLGKVVDSILPCTDAFKTFRNKTIVGSMKTTLRERWQEVVEEITRSNLPNIYLLTTDDKISGDKIKQMSEHNIVLVVYQSLKTQEKLKSKHSVISFETYFREEIPNTLKYWRNNG